jgi:hypothetical protein
LADEAKGGDGAKSALREISFTAGRQRSGKREKLPESFYSKALKRALPGGAEIEAKDHLTRNARCLI